MSQRKMLAREIRMVEAEIDNLEVKRARSQAALINALISNEAPDPTDVRFFRAINAQIEGKRDYIQKLTKELEATLK